MAGGPLHGGIRPLNGLSASHCAGAAAGAPPRDRLLRAEVVRPAPRPDHERMDCPAASDGGALSLVAADAVRDHVVLWSQTVPGRIDLSTLDDTERQRVHAAATPETARRRATSFTLVRRALAEVLHTDARRIAVDRACGSCGRPHGPPRVVTDPGLFVSVTHVGARPEGTAPRPAVVTVALTRVAPVGVDIVDVDDVQFPGFAALALHLDDGLTLDATARARVWARKEAVLKALGVGLRIEPTSFPAGSPGVVQVPEHAPVSVDDVDLRWPAAEGSFALDAEAAEHTVGAVALARSAPLVPVRWMPPGQG